jgi:hypothetical protein
MESPNYIANGTIQPSTFVVADTTIANGVDQAVGTAAFLVGIAQEWSKLAPLPNATTEAADVGDPIKIYGLGAQCFLQSTSAGWTAGDRLTSSATGAGITASGAQHYGAIALTTLTGVGLGRVQVVLGTTP